MQQRIPLVASDSSTPDATISGPDPDATPVKLQRGQAVLYWPNAFLTIPNIDNAYVGLITRVIDPVAEIVAVGGFTAAGYPVPSGEVCARTAVPTWGGWMPPGP